MPIGDVSLTRGDDARSARVQVASGRYGDRVDDDDERQNLETRTEIVSAFIRAVENPEKLFRVCATVSGGRDDERAAVAAEFEVSDVVADAILDLQVRRFTPRSIEQMRNELADYDRRLAELDRP
jgi:DNA gyrase/topoisomerase IV subunit A